MIAFTLWAHSFKKKKSYFFQIWRLDPAWTPGCPGSSSSAGLERENTTKVLWGKITDQLPSQEKQTQPGGFNLLLIKLEQDNEE